MVNISIDVTDLGGEARPGDKVVLWKPAAAGSSSHAGRVISTAPVDVFLTNGKASVPDVEPGDMRVLLQCRGVESQGPIDVTVPDGTGTVTLRSLIESQFEYAPPIVSAVQEAAANASASERAAIEAQVRSEAAADRADAKVDDAINNGANLVRGEVKQDADRAVAARRAATQSESNAKASEGKAATSESNAKTSETNAKQSEANAGDYAAVATTAATEAVDAMGSVSEIIGANYATHEYVDSFAEQVDKDVADINRHIAPIDVYRDDSFAVTDSLNRVAFEVDADGNTRMGATGFVESTPGFRIVDAEDRVAFEVGSDGRTRIADLVDWDAGDDTETTVLHAFICAGQSNMSGRGDPVDATLDVENPRLLQFGAKRRTIEPAPAILDMMDTPIGLSPAREFGKRYISEQPENVAILLIPAAHGGTGFTYEPTPGRKTWTKGHADTPENALYENALQQTKDALQSARDAGYSVELKGLLWHQGEANGSSLPQNMQSYAEQLDGLISNFRTDLDSPDLPAVVGEMMPEGMRDSVAKRSIGYIHAQTPQRVQRTAFAPAPDNTMRHGDFAHFSREGAILLGESFYEAFSRAVLNVPSGKPRAPRNIEAYRVGNQVTVSWAAPMSRVTEYLVEWADAPDGTWQVVTREWPMNLGETFAAHDDTTWVRVTALEDSASSTPSNPIPALGA